jgi:hypothetical protein
VWTEQLHFPWWMGGPLGATAARPVLRHVWRTNLRNLRAIVEADRPARRRGRRRARDRGAER